MYCNIRTTKPRAVELGESLVKVLDNHNLYTNVVDLQNFIFVLWCKYFKDKNGEYLFDEPFRASSVGPKVSSIRDRFCVYAYEIHPYGWKDVKEDPYFVANIKFIKKLYRNSKKLRNIVNTSYCKKFYKEWCDNDYDKGFWVGGFNRPYELEEIPFSYIAEDIDNILKQVNALP